MPTQYPWNTGQQQEQEGPAQLRYDVDSGNFYSPAPASPDDATQLYSGRPNPLQRGGPDAGGQTYALTDDARRSIWEQHQNSLLSQQPSGSVVERNGVQYVNAPSHVPNTLSHQSDARDNMAQVHRGMWEGYQRRFIPAENALMASVGNHGAALEQVGQSIDQQYEKQAREHQRGLAGLGIGMTQDQQRSFDRSQAVNKASAKAGAMNTARMGLRDRDIATLGGGLGTLAQQRQNPGQP